MLIFDLGSESFSLFLKKEDKKIFPFQNQFRNLDQLLDAE